ncbi:MAG: ribosome silencing factor [Deferribacterales bacterium]
MAEDTLLRDIVKYLDDKKAEHIEIYKIAEKSSLADFLVIATANSNTHANSLADFILHELKGQKVEPQALDGYKVSKWICIDFGHILLNIMCEDERNYYNLEAIWGGCSKIDASQFIEAPQK